VINVQEPAKQVGERFDSNSQKLLLPIFRSDLPLRLRWRLSIDNNVSYLLMLLLIDVPSMVARINIDGFR
jgi:hypothetical protein